MPRILECKWFVVDQESEDMRRYTTRLRLLDEAEGINIVSARAGTKTAQTADGRIFDLPPVAALVLAIEGVAATTVQPYSIDIAKRPTHTWEEIDKHMVPLIYGVKDALDLPGFVVDAEWPGYKEIKSDAE